MFSNLTEYQKLFVEEQVPLQPELNDRLAECTHTQFKAEELPQVIPSNFCVPTTTTNDVPAW